jgi:ribosome-associated protein
MHDDHDNDPDAVPSKSEVKRRMLALQDLGEALTQLSDKQLERVPVSDERLLAAILESRNIRSKNARKRHLQFIGKLMRDIDPEPLQAALDALHSPARARNEAFHALEAMRDELLARGPAGVDSVLARWPHADRQQLRQLLLQHQREQQRGKPPAASRKLFRYLRELMETCGNGAT